MSDHELVQQLLARVQQLEAEVRDLKSQRDGASPPVAEPRQPAAAQATPETMPAVMGSPVGMQFRGFSDISFRASDRPGETNSFALGQFNLFITSRLSDRISVLAESVFEANNQNAFGLDLERLLLTYTASDHLSVSFGRYHTAIGFYNTAYHHSTWMQTAVGRPFLFAFEDQGGVLPIHNVGLSATGRFRSGGLNLHYVAEIGNGRTSRSRLDEPVQNVRDENNGKAVNMAVFVRPERLSGFQAGFSVYRDGLRPLGFPRVGQTILAGHVVYQTSTWEWLSEAVLIRHAISGGRTLRTPAWYLQGSRKFGAFRPYFRYQYINVPALDPMFSDVGLQHGPSAGIRYDFSEFAAFKLQYDRSERRVLPGSNGLETQLSFTF